MHMHLQINNIKSIIIIFDYQLDLLAARVDGLQAKVDQLSSKLDEEKSCGSIIKT